MEPTFRPGSEEEKLMEAEQSGLSLTRFLGLILKAIRKAWPK